MSSFGLTDAYRFDRDLRILGSTGLASGLVASLLVAIGGGHFHALMALAFGGVFGVAASLAPGEGETPILRVIAGLLGAVVFASAAPWSLLGAAAAGAAFGGGLTVEDSMVERLGSMFASAAALAAGSFTTSTLLGAGGPDVSGVPVVSAVLTGGIWATFLAAAAGVRRLRWSGDSVTRRVERAARELGAPESDRLASALELYEPTRRAFDDLTADRMRRRAESITDEVLRALVRFCERSAELRAASVGGRPETLESRIADLEERIERAERDEIEHELRAARRDLLRESEVRERIDTAVTRLEVRQERCLTAVERLHMNLVESGAAGGAEVRLESSIDELDALTDEMEWRNLSLEAICSNVEQQEGEAALDGTEVPADRTEKAHEHDEVLETSGAHVEAAETSS